MGFLSDIIEAFVPSNIENLLSAPIPAIEPPDVSFQPFTVTGGMGTITGGPGGTSYTLDPTGQAIQSALETSALSRFGAVPAEAGALRAAGVDLLGVGQQQLGMEPFGLGGQQQAAQQAFGLGQQFMGQAGMPMGAREQEVYDRIRATQLGEEERQRLALEERLASQGRLGVRTAMFGGTPEQLALAKAQESAQNQAALIAMQQAQREQQQQAALGAQFAGLGSGLAGQRQALEAAQQMRAMQALQGSMGLMTGGLGLEQAQQQIGLGALQGAYVPQAAMLSAFSPALNVASMADVARRQQGEFDLEAQMADVAGTVGQRTALANLYGGIYGGLASGLGGLLSGAFDLSNLNPFD